MEQQWKQKLAKPYQGKVLFSLRPERIKLSAEGAGERLVRGTIENVTFLGEKVSYSVRLPDGSELEVQEHAVQPHMMRKAKQTVYLDLQLDKATMFDEAGREVLSRAAY
ncbi:TOBE domain-containing protein [Gordoniibacillus kamchatkensis]|uniref:TOBE domain-containing protein n=1 Tax=Gordoniibacillus kamchatkensis TaxID=1590651 RepID=UPI000B2E4867